MSTITLDPPRILTDPPELPPFLRKRGPERPRVIILADIRWIEQRTLIRDREHNWVTILYQWMNRITGEGVFDSGAKWEGAHTSTRRYRQWLETYELRDGIPPHISFGGAIEAGPGDPTFHDRWKAYAREMFW